MKRIVSFVLLLITLAAMSVATFAAAPTVADFKANNGFYIFEGKGYRTDRKDPATLADTARGLRIAHGGYYSSGDNCGGVVSNEKYDLNGLSVTLYFEKVPYYDTSTDCWGGFFFLAAPRAFYTNNFNVENGGNQGIYELIRFGKPYLETYEGVNSFSQTWNSQSLPGDVNKMFRISAGTTLTVTVLRTRTNGYTLTFSREGFEDLTVPYEWQVGDIFADGKAYVSVVFSSEYAGDDGFVYYITNITNGLALTEEEASAMESAKAAEKLAADTDAAMKETDRVAEDVDEVTARAEATGYYAAIDKAAEAQAAIDASYAAIEAADFEEAKMQSDLARDLVKETKDLCKWAEEWAYEEKTYAEAAPEVNYDYYDDYDDYDSYSYAESTDSPFISSIILLTLIPLFIVIVVIVAVIVVIVVVVNNKKKNSYTNGYMNQGYYNNGYNGYNGYNGNNVYNGNNGGYPPRTSGAAGNPGTSYGMANPGAADHGNAQSNNNNDNINR